MGKDFIVLFVCLAEDWDSKHISLYQFVNKIFSAVKSMLIFMTPILPQISKDEFVAGHIQNFVKPCRIL